MLIGKLFILNHESVKVSLLLHITFVRLKASISRIIKIFYLFFI